MNQITPSLPPPPALAPAPHAESYAKYQGGGNQATGGGEAFPKYPPSIPATAAPPAFDGADNSFNPAAYNSRYTGRLLKDFFINDLFKMTY